MNRRREPAGPYAYETIQSRIEALKAAWETRQYFYIIDMVRQSSRGFGRISKTILYRKAFSGTKYNIETYVCLLAQSLGRIVDSWPHGLPMPDGSVKTMPLQDLMDFAVQARQTHGRTALVLKGGAAFGMAHLGVAKALRRHGLLPRLIVGDSTGALIAALICTRSEDELDGVLDGSSINLDAFATRNSQESLEKPIGLPRSIYLAWKRVRRWYREGHVLDPQVIVECARANLGSVTFREAYERTGRILNIVVYEEQTSSVLNYLSAPDIVSAMLASKIGFY